LEFSFIKITMAWKVMSILALALALSLSLPVLQIRAFLESDANG